MNDEMRAKLEAYRAQKDRDRGRPLTARERLANIAEALTTCDGCGDRIEWGTEVCPHCRYRLM